MVLLEPQLLHSAYLSVFFFSPHLSRTSPLSRDVTHSDTTDRIDALTKKLVERLRPFVEAKTPGEKDDPETLVYEERTRKEAEDLKYESFGVEVSFPPDPSALTNSRYDIT